MILATAFGLLLFLALLFGDWYQFTSLQPIASRYGCGVARREDRELPISIAALHDRFDPQGLLQLPHGMARLFHDERIIVIRPYYQLFTMRFRTAWPLKGTIEVDSEREETLHFKLVKRMPWSSALITLLWLGIVGLGTMTFLILFGFDGGFGSVGEMLMGSGVGICGLLVLAFGVLLVSLAYRLEDQRLMQVYQELRDVVTGAETCPEPVEGKHDSFYKRIILSDE